MEVANLIGILGFTACGIQAFEINETGSKQADIFIKWVLQSLEQNFSGSNKSANSNSNNNWSWTATPLCLLVLKSVKKK